MTPKPTHEILLYKHSNPTTEAYGFSLAMVASVVWVLWVLWAILPEWLLISLGIRWFPNRDWAYLLPAWSIMLFLFIYVGFVSWNVFQTPPMDALELVVDQHAVLYTRPLTEERGHPLQQHTIRDITDMRGPLSDDVYDVSPGLISRARYLNR